ncbi:MAG: DUF4231 domain-containing protein [Chloroflexi bacterium]|nr:DUF4231 domain-containing protein [Chloroflexota bacterium]
MAATTDLDPTARSTLAIVGAVALAFVPYTAMYRTSREQVRNWVRARSVSEGLKEDIYRFLAGGPPYGADRDMRQFVDRRDAILNAAGDLEKYDAEVTAEQSSQAEKRPTAPLNADEYVDKRVNQQITGYYEKQSRRNARRAGLFRQCVFSVGLLAAIFGVISSGTAGGFRWDVPQWIPQLGPWVAVLTTISAAVTAHMAAARYDELSVNYAATARQLTRLRDRFDSDPQRADQAVIEKFVDEVESAISSENETWRAAWTDEKTAATA